MRPWFPANTSAATVTVAGAAVAPHAAVSNSTQIVFTAPAGAPSSTSAGTVVGRCRLTLSNPS